MDATNSIIIEKLPIRLGQLLKYLDLVQDGIEAKIVIQEGQVLVNGTVETRRGRQLHHLDTVSWQNQSWTIQEGQND